VVVADATLLSAVVKILLTDLLASCWQRSLGECLLLAAEIGNRPLALRIPRRSTPNSLDHHKAIAQANSMPADMLNGIAQRRAESVIPL
jgi:hypothetical protein